ncbi:hypothetical protein PPL_09907 [Heterostelium album PN500]|uniref:Uncharacterized protein n=1 Tax=Heterostelium pallidum (strain ATCC 26659 / Pp 5 / PN500) TaxID=670386 RepID=D3BPP0_HETP5|nr:hypothetical protein PPL_09907 [Heterostelium album PN500]EFA76602.1 hypothetical protein PPL_09907 [Heterostelium album PN500]|eukprot:XP_020428734.1 hypothetical protein PPL_09907 [Heterostelium album PN500]
MNRLYRLHRSQQHLLLSLNTYQSANFTFNHTNRLGGLLSYHHNHNYNPIDSKQVHNIHVVGSRSFSSKSKSKKEQKQREQHQQQQNAEIQELTEDEKRLEEFESKLKNVTIGSMLKQIGILLALALRGHMSMHVNRWKYREFYEHVMELLRSKKDVIETVTQRNFEFDKIQLKNFVVFTRDSPLARAMKSNNMSMNMNNLEYFDDDDNDDIKAGGGGGGFEPIVISMTLMNANELDRFSVDAVIIGKAEATPIDGDSGLFGRMMPRKLPLLGNLNSKATLQTLSLLLENVDTGQQQEFPLVQAEQDLRQQTTTTSTTFHTEQDEMTIIQETKPTSSYKSSKDRQQTEATTIELDDYNEKSNTYNNHNQQQNTNKKSKY